MSIEINEIIYHVQTSIKGMMEANQLPKIKNKKRQTPTQTKKTTGEENYTNPLKLGVVHSTTRSWSSSILKKGQFSQPDSRNCRHDQYSIQQKVRKFQRS